MTSSGSIQDAHSQGALSKIYSETLEHVRKGFADSRTSCTRPRLRLVGLATALRGHCVEVEKRHAVQVRFTADGEFGDVHPDVAVCFFRIAQESLRNGVVHGEARQLSVSLARSGEQVELIVTDDGRGFDLEEVRSERQRPRTGEHRGAGARDRRRRSHRHRSRPRNHDSRARSGGRALRAR